MTQTVVLITGGSRGLGLGLVAKFLSQPNHTVIAANRDPTNPASQSLLSLPHGTNSNIIIVKYNAAIEGSAAEAVIQVQDQGVTHIDIVVANAAILNSYPMVKDALRQEIMEHFSVNVFGPVELYQATRDLLQKSTAAPSGKPKFVVIGSSGGSLSRQPPVSSAYYGASKSALPWYGKRINAEDEWLNAFVLDPGWVQTEMGNAGAREFGLKEAPGKVEDSVEGMFNMLATGTKEAFGGKVVEFTGEVLPF